MKGLVACRFVGGDVASRHGRRRLPRTPLNLANDSLELDLGALKAPPLMIGPEVDPVPPTVRSYSCAKG